MGLGLCLVVAISRCVYKSGLPKQSAFWHVVNLVGFPAPLVELRMNKSFLVWLRRQEFVRITITELGDKMEFRISDPTGGPVKLGV